MSRKKPAVPQLLGPDGKPLDRAKYAPKPETVVGIDAANGTDSTVTVTTSGGRVMGMSVTTAYMDEMVRHMLRPGLSSKFTTTIGKPKPKPLAERVADDIDALTADLDFAGRPELPKPPADLTTYADAYEAARKTCPHEDVEDTVHSRGEFLCLDCRRYLTRAELMAARRARGGIFGWFGQ